MVEILENYKNYHPPKAVFKSVNRLIKNTPEKYLTGLNLIHLTNTEALNRKSRRQKTKSRKRKFSLSRCEGWYVGKWNNQPARIELVIDNILYDLPGFLLKFGFFLDMVISSTLFHEIGHHIHETQSPEYSEREDVADNWEHRLSRKYFWKRYWYMMVLIFPFKNIIKWMNKNINKNSN